MTNFPRKLALVAAMPGCCQLLDGANLAVFGLGGVPRRGRGNGRAESGSAGEKEALWGRLWEATCKAFWRLRHRSTGFCFSGDFFSLGPIKAPFVFF